MTTKDAKIIKDSEERKIPIFVLTAKDVLSVPIIKEYFHKCIDLNCDKDFLKGIAERLDEFQTWQKDWYWEVKDPD